MGYSVQTWSCLDIVELADELLTLRAAGNDRDDTDDQRLHALEELASDLGVEDLHDATNLYPLVMESDFAEFVRDDVPQIVEIPDFIQSYVRWDDLAADYRMDFSEVDFEGETYLYRE